MACWRIPLTENSEFKRTIREEPQNTAKSQGRKRRVPIADRATGLLFVNIPRLSTAARYLR